VGIPSDSAVGKPPDSAEGKRDLAHRGLVIALSVLFAAGLLFLLFAVGAGGTNGSVREALLLVCIAALSSALGAAALTGFNEGFHTVNREGIKRREWKGLFKPRSEGVAATPRRAVSETPALTGLARIVHVLVTGMEALGARLVVMLKRTARRTGDVLKRALDRLIRWILLVEYAVRREVIWLARLLRVATLDAVDALREAAKVAGSIVCRWTESTVLGLLLLLLAAEIAALACELFSSYLNGGTLPEGIGALALVLPAAGALVGVWWTLTRWSVKEIVASVQHTFEGTAPTLLLTLVALGWADGIAGLLGLGPIRPGWLTIGGSLILAAVAVYSYLDQRREGESPGSLDLESSEV
jgi:hypothetical protein